MLFVPRINEIVGRASKCHLNFHSALYFEPNVFNHRVLLIRYHIRLILKLLSLTYLNDKPLIILIITTDRDTRRANEFDHSVLEFIIRNQVIDVIKEEVVIVLNCYLF